MRQRTIALIAGAVALIVLIGVFAWWAVAFRDAAPEESPKSGYLAWTAYQRVKNELEVSERMTISDAERLLSDAWYHIACSMTKDWTEHMFFFGSRDLDKTGVVLVEARKREQGEVVTNVYYVENYMAVQYDCVKADPILSPSK